MSLFGGFGAVCRMIKIEHSVFALPFAYAGAFLAARGWPGGTTLFFLTAAMVGIRSFAMAFNRLADLPYDRLNPRSAAWPLVTGALQPAQTRRFCWVMALLFAASCAALNSLCLALSPLALLLAAGYSYTKRFTWLCHFALGAVIGLAPLAGWLSVSPAFALPPVLLSLAVVFWLAGFDILYAFQDREFDQEHGLHSVPARFGTEAGLVMSSFCHVNTLLFLLLCGAALGLGWGWYACLAGSGAILWREHSIVSVHNLSRVRTAFAMNGLISVLLFLGTLLGI